MTALVFLLLFCLIQQNQSARISGYVENYLGEPIILELNQGMENITLNGTRPFVFQSEIPLHSAFYVTILKNTKHCLVNPNQGILTENKKIIHVICSSK